MVTQLLLLAMLTVMVLAPVGSLLLVALTVGFFTQTFRDDARILLRQGAITGAGGAVLAVLIFLLIPDVMLPGAGTAAVVLAAFMTGFAVRTGATLLRSRVR